MTVLNFPVRKHRPITPSGLQQLGIPGTPGAGGIVLDEPLGSVGDLELRRTVFTYDERLWEVGYAVHTHSGEIWWGSHHVRASAVEARQHTVTSYEVVT